MQRQGVLTSVGFAFASEGTNFHLPTHKSSRVKKTMPRFPRHTLTKSISTTAHENSGADPSLMPANVSRASVRDVVSMGRVKRSSHRWRHDPQHLRTT